MHLRAVIDERRAAQFLRNLGAAFLGGFFVGLIHDHGKFVAADARQEV